MAKILMTGATGFIGSHAVENLARNHHVLGLYHQKEPPRGLKKAIWIKKDLSLPINGLNLPTSPDIIIHFAQSRHYRDFPERSRDIFDVNIRSTFSLLEFGRKVGIQKFIYASSGGIYGYSYERFMETDIINPVNFYLTSKYCSELLIANYNNFFTTVIFRFFFVYGKEQKEMLIPRLIKRIREKAPIILHGESGIRINPIHISDAVKIFAPAVESKVSGVFNVSGDEVMSIRELAEIIGDLIGESPRFVREKSSIPGDVLGDNSRMKSVLGVIPEVSLKEGISAMIQASSTDQRK